jgi:hypothetical protein
MTPRLGLPLTVALFLAASGCAPLLTTPAGFVELDERRTQYDYRATTADGLVIAARKIDHDPKGSMEFWVQAIENEMRNRGGYALLGKTPVKTKRGLAGTQLRFGHDQGREPHLYYIVIVVTEGDLYLLEAGGTKALLEKNAAQIAAAFQSLDAG